MITRIHLPLSVCLLLLLSAPAFCYDVVLKNGKVIRGQVISESETYLILKDSSGVWLNLSKSEIDPEKTAVANHGKEAAPSKKAGRVVTKEDLEKLREKYDLGQKSFGEATILRWEEKDEGATIEENPSFETEVLNANGPVLVEFWAAWCGPCRKIAPVLDEIAAEFDGKAKVYKVNIDKDRSTARKYEISAIPALLYFNNGELVDRMIGLAPKKIIVQKLQLILDGKI